MYATTTVTYYMARSAYWVAVAHSVITGIGRWPQSGFVTILRDLVAGVN